MHPVAQRGAPRRREQVGQVRLLDRRHTPARHHGRTHHREVCLAQGVQLHEEPEDGRGGAGRHLGQGDSFRYTTGCPKVRVTTQQNNSNPHMSTEGFHDPLNYTKVMGDASCKTFRHPVGFAPAQGALWYYLHSCQGRYVRVPRPERNRVRLLHRHFRGAPPTPQASRGALPGKQTAECEQQGEEASPNSKDQ